MVVVVQLKLQQITRLDLNLTSTLNKTFEKINTNALFTAIKADLIA